MSSELYMECEEEELEPWQREVMEEDEEEEMDVVCQVKQEEEFVNGPGFAVSSAPPPAPSLLRASPLIGSSFAHGMSLIGPNRSQGLSLIGRGVTQGTSLTGSNITPVMSVIGPNLPTMRPVVGSQNSQARSLIGSNLTPGSFTIGSNVTARTAVTSPQFSLATSVIGSNRAPAASVIGSNRAPVVSVIGSNRGPAASVIGSSVPAGSSAIGSGLRQGQPLILTQGPGGTFFLSTSQRHITGSSPNQPFLFTTQSLMPVQTSGGAGMPKLLLNLQTGQTLQPLTLIQHQPLVRAKIAPKEQAFSVTSPPSSLAPTLTSTAAPAAPVWLTPPSPQASTVPPSRYTAKVIPASVSITTATPAPNNPTRAVPKIVISKTFKAAIPTETATSDPAHPLRVVMTVYEFYYGVFCGDGALQTRGPVKLTAPFHCKKCLYTTKRNMEMMKHYWQHTDMARSMLHEDMRCDDCFRLFSSAALLEIHQLHAHLSKPKSTVCRICEWVFDNEMEFLNHMKTNHKPGEMPYVCQVCSYRSSFYSDVLHHFRCYHSGRRQLLCILCLKVTNNIKGFQNHMDKHKLKESHPCAKCRLQFVLPTSLQEHKQQHHRSFRRPHQLNGLPPGAMVTIKTVGMKPNSLPLPSRGKLSSSHFREPLVVPPPQPQPIESSPPDPPTPPGPAPTGAKLQDNSDTESAEERDRLLCMECGNTTTDFSSHYPASVSCLLCPYRTFCSCAYASHMIQNHVLARERGKRLPLHQRPPPCCYELVCTQCGFVSLTGDKMAKHLGLHRGHASSTCRPHTTPKEPDLLLGLPEPLPPSDRPDPGPLSWTRAPGGPVCRRPLAFKQARGPRHTLAQNADAMDYFLLAYPEPLLELIAKETNAHVKTCRYLGAPAPNWTPLGVPELKAFLGLVILMGVHGLADLAQYWDPVRFPQCDHVDRAMSLRRFKQIAANVRPGSLLADRVCGGGCGDPADALGVLRPMLKHLGEAMWKVYRPNCHLSVDRTLLPALEDRDGDPPDGQAPPEIWLLCDSKSGYCHRLHLHTRGGGEAAEEGGEALGLAVVPRLMRGLHDKNHRLYLANALASPKLMCQLLLKGVYASSSFPVRSPVLPETLWREGDLTTPGHFLQWRCGPLLATRWRDAKEMGCLCTNAVAGSCDTVWRRSQTEAGTLDPLARPMAFKLLQENMRGVDICKQLQACNPLGGVPRDRHWRSLFWLLLNLSVANAFIVLRESRKRNPPCWVEGGLFSQLKFRRRLGTQLARCYQRPPGLEPPGGGGGDGGDEEEAEGDPLKEVHRMARISFRTRRCKNCDPKQGRHESVYGCSACKVNLCTQTSCFWEFHALDPPTKVSPSVGFTRDKISGAIEIEGQVVQRTAATPREDRPDVPEDREEEEGDEDEAADEDEDEGAVTEEEADPLRYTFRPEDEEMEYLAGEADDDDDEAATEEKADPLRYTFRPEDEEEEFLAGAADDEEAVTEEKADPLRYTFRPEDEEMEYLAAEAATPHQPKREEEEEAVAAAASAGASGPAGGAGQLVPRSAEAERVKEEAPVAAARRTPSVGSRAAAVARRVAAAASAETSRPAGGAAAAAAGLGARQLRVCLVALCSGLQHAACEFVVELAQVQAWVEQARRRWGGASAGVGAEPGEDHMLEWVWFMREQQLPVTEGGLFKHAATLKNNGVFADAFRISYNWAVGLMLRHGLGPPAPGHAPLPPLPALMAAGVRSFTEFTRRQVTFNQIAPSAVAGVTRLSVFLDRGLMARGSPPALRSHALRLSGTGTPLLTVYLTALADGTLLPALVLLWDPTRLGGPLDDASDPPSSFLVETDPHGFTSAEGLEVWVKRVWRPHASAPPAAGGGGRGQHHRKRLLVLDRHRDHVAEAFLEALGRTRTLPAMIPSGCGLRLQPLRVAALPVLQRLLVARWRRLSAGPQAAEHAGAARQRLSGWLQDALNVLRDRPSLIRASFRLTGLSS
ncbi:pogo transposable element with ZNF domain [Gadus chalcogrammus]|uniref:pogo transposable element with ZNF domain n=1 Tax=Gadus chalcogrammus TaxID=1042646 RepID=UPI0024C23014|nr:pogo transposable element with ZNF domain [Gadus chalcogrammus]